MAAPAPVQLQRPVTVSDLVCCVFVYGLHVLHIAKICAENNTCVDVTYARNPSRRLRIGALGENCNNIVFSTQETTRFWVTALLGLLPHKMRFFTIFLRRNVVLSP